MTRFSYDRPESLHALRADLYESFGWTYRGKALPPPGLHLVAATKMIFSPSGLWRCDGHLSGSAFRGVPFEMFEVTAQPAPNPKPDSDPGFSGLLIAFTRPVGSLSRTIIKHDRGRLNRKSVDDLKRVGLVDAAFEARFEVFSDDQVESRAILTPDFMERLMAFDAKPFYRRVQLGCLGNQIYIVIPSGDHLRFGGDLRVSTAEQAIARVTSEMCSVFDVMKDVDSLQACAGRKTEADIELERMEHYAACSAVVEERVRLALESGVLQGDTRPDWMTEDGAYVVDPMLRGLLRPRF